MTIRTSNGRTLTHASWLGHSWVRVWMPETETAIAGWLHFGPGDFTVLSAKDLPQQLQK